MGKFIYWSPRVLSLLFVLFLSVFAFDVFGEYSGGKLFVALFIHLIPPLILLAAIIIAWRQELVGVVVFWGFALWYLIAVGFGQVWHVYVLIIGPAALTGALYLVSWLRKEPPEVE